MHPYASSHYGTEMKNHSLVTMTLGNHDTEPQINPLEKQIWLSKEEVKPWKM